MTEASYEKIRNEILEELKGHDVTSEEYATALNALEKLNKAEASQKVPETPEPKGVKAWLGKHSDALIKVGGTLSVVGLISIVEGKEIIFRSKASKYL